MTDKYFDLLQNFDHWLVVFYALGPLVALIANKKITSLSVVLLFVWASEAIMKEVNDPLLVYAFDESVNHLIRKTVWYGAWILVDIIFVAAIFIAHLKLSLNTGRAYKFACLFYCIMATLQFMGYVDSIYIQSTIVDVLYTWLIPTINTVFGIYLLIELGMELGSRSRTIVKNQTMRKFL